MATHTKDGNCKCAYCTNTPAKIREMESEMLNEHGYIGHFVFETPIPGIINAHTHLMPELWDHPDIQLIIATRPEIISTVIKEITDAVKQGKKFKEGYTYEDILADGYRVKFKMVKENGRDVLRCIIPDRNGSLREDAEGIFGLQHKIGDLATMTYAEARKQELLPEPPPATKMVEMFIGILKKEAKVEIDVSPEQIDRMGSLLQGTINEHIEEYERELDPVTLHDIKRNNPICPFPPQSPEYRLMALDTLIPMSAGIRCCEVCKYPAVKGLVCFECRGREIENTKEENVERPTNQ